MRLCIGLAGAQATNTVVVPASLALHVQSRRFDVGRQILRDSHIEAIYVDCGVLSLAVIMLSLFVYGMK